MSQLDAPDATSSSGSSGAREIARAFGARLRELRREDVVPRDEDRYISRRGLARKTGLSPATIGLLERGEHEPRLSTMLALREAFGLGTIEELLGPMPSARFTLTGSSDQSRET